MGIVADFFKDVLKGAQIIVKKVGSFVLLSYVLGMLYGIYIFTFGLNAIYFLVPIVSLAIMWEDFGWGVMVFIILTAIAILNPNLTFLPFG